MQILLSHNITNIQELGTVSILTLGWEMGGKMEIERNRRHTT